MPAPAVRVVPVLAAALLLMPLAPARASAVAPSAAPQAASLSSDFDGDGAPDVAVGRTGNGAEVFVTYANGRTQTIERSQLDGSLNSGFGSALLAADLNADGYADLVVADSGYRPGDERLEGLFILWGSPSGITTTSAYHQDAPSQVAGFGAAVALVEKPERLLVVGAPGEAAGAVRGGAVVAYRLGPDGRPFGSPTIITQDSPGVPGSAERLDGFGSAVAASGRLLLVGVPGEDVGRRRDAGAMTVLSYQGSGRFTGTGITRATKGVPGTPRTRDALGTSVAIGDGYAAVGVPGQSSGRGAVQLFRINGTRLVPGAAISQSTRGVPGVSEAGDRFGAAVAMARPCAGKVGVVVGAPGETLPRASSAGAGWVIPLARTSGCPARSYSEDRALGAAAREDARIGAAVAVVRGSAPGAADGILIAGAGSEDETGSIVYRLDTASAKPQVLHRAGWGEIALSQALG